MVRVDVYTVNTQPMLSSRSRQASVPEFQLASSKSDEHKLVAELVQFALSIHRTAQGRRALNELGLQLVDGLGRHCIYGGGRNARDMAQWVDFFLIRLSQQFPPIYIENTAGEAHTVRLNWGNDMSRWQPATAGTISLHRTIINNMIVVNAGITGAPEPAMQHIYKDSYKTFKFQMSIVLAHEITHLFTGFFTGSAFRTTPPPMKPLGWVETTKDEFGTDVPIGEIGRLWEVKLFGHTIEFFADPMHQLGRRQAGIPAFVLPPERGSRIRRLKWINHSYIQEFYNRQFEFPIQSRSVASNTVPVTGFRDIVGYVAGIENSPLPNEMRFTGRHPAFHRYQPNVGSSSRTDYADPYTGFR